MILRFCFFLLCGGWLALADDAVLLEHLLAQEPPHQIQGRHYPRDPDIQVLHLRLDLTPDFATREIAGKAVLTFKTLNRPVSAFALDAVNLEILSVTSSAQLAGYDSRPRDLKAGFVHPIPPGQTNELTIVYRAHPEQGLYFRTPENGYPETHLWTQGESEESRHWFPGYDYPNQKFSSEVICHLPPGMIGLSNGRLIEEVKENDGRIAFHWSQEKPHANYLITLVAGIFKKLEGRHGNIPLGFYTVPSDFPQANNSFRETGKAMEFFEKEIGVPYPWARYDQVCVQDFHWGGMENTTQTTLSDRTLFTEATENIRSSDGLVAHELAHQWFGDLLTCSDWSHAWLNEGFATYYTGLFEGHKNGPDALSYAFYRTLQSIVTRTNDDHPVVSRQFNDPEQQFRQYGFLAYGKGSWILRMLRSQLGEEVFRRGITTYVERFSYKNVSTDQFRAVLEEVSGRNLDRFFDQWVYHAHHPELEIEFSWQPQNKLAHLVVQQVQRTNENVLTFQFPLTVRFSGSAGPQDETITVSKAREDFYFPLADAPSMVRIDPNLELLAKIKFTSSFTLLRHQSEKGDTIGRILALHLLAARPDERRVGAIETALNGDNFYGTRLEAARALQSIKEPYALAALLRSTAQSDARVRQQVQISISSFFDEKALGSEKKALEKEKNPDVIAAILRGLAHYPQDATAHRLLLQSLGRKSYRETIARATVAALRSGENPVDALKIAEWVDEQGEALAGSTVAEGIDAIAYLARNETEKGTSRQWIMRRLGSPKKTVRIAAIAGLGTLEDPQSLGLLQTYLNGPLDSPERIAAEKAIAQIQAARRPVDQLKELREEILQLKKQSATLQREVDAAKKEGAAARRCR